MTYPPEPPTEGQPYYPPTSPQPYNPLPVQQPVLTVKQVPTSGLATASMIMGIIGFVSSCCAFGIPSIIAVILGHFALAETKRGDKGGHGMAIAGLILGYFVVVPAIIFSIFFVFGGGLAAFDSSSTSTP